jgi:hypothetical protein
VAGSCPEEAAGCGLGAAALPVYALVNTAAIRYFWRKTRDFNWLLHGVLPGLGALLVAALLIGQIAEQTTAPYTWFPWVIVAWVVLVGAVTIWLGRTRPEQIRSAGQALAGEEMAGQLADAIATFTSVAAQRSRILGPAHPDSLTSRVALALARADSGDTVAAVPGLMSALEDTEHSVGPRTVPALTIRIHLADCHTELGNTGEAAAMLRRAAADYRAVLGPAAPMAVALQDEAFALQPPGTAEVYPDADLSPRAVERGAR